MQDISALAQRVILIGKGRILMDGTLEDVRKAGGAQDDIDQAVANLYRKLDIL